MLVARSPKNFQKSCPVAAIGRTVANSKRRTLPQPPRFWPNARKTWTRQSCGKVELAEINRYFATFLRIAKSVFRLVRAIRLAWT